MAAVDDRLAEYRGRSHVHRLRPAEPSHRVRSPQWPSRDASHRALAVDPSEANTIWLLVEDLAPIPSIEAVYGSRDGGESWALMDEGLEGVRVHDLVYHGEAVLAATDNGIYRRAVGQPPQEPPTGHCQGSPITLCLRAARFRVEVDFRDHRGHRGRAIVGPSSNDTGVFWFFNSDNWEMLVKVLDGCAINAHFWVFGAATTNVEYTLRVTDTDTDREATYFNPLGQSAAAVTDTLAFATCP